MWVSCIRVNERRVWSDLMLGYLKLYRCNLTLRRLCSFFTVCLSTMLARIFPYDWDAWMLQTRNYTKLVKFVYLSYFVYWYVTNGVVMKCRQKGKPLPHKNFEICFLSCFLSGWMSAHGRCVGIEISKNVECCS